MIAVLFALALAVPSRSILAEAQYSTQTLQGWAYSESIRDGVNPYFIEKLITCESQWNPRAVSKTDDYGIAQIHLAAHPNVSYEAAIDPYYAIDWTIKQVKEGKKDMWTCTKSIEA